MTNRDRKRTKKRVPCVTRVEKNEEKKWRFKRDSACFWSSYHYKQHQSAAFLMKTPKEIALNFVNWFGCPILTDFWSTPYV